MRLILATVAVLALTLAAPAAARPGQLGAEAIAALSFDELIYAMARDRDLAGAIHAEANRRAPRRATATDPAALPVSEAERERLAALDLDELEAEATALDAEVSALIARGEALKAAGEMPSAAALAVARGQAAPPPEAEAPPAEDVPADPAGGE